MSFFGKTIVVTGAGSGIGKATALLLASERAKVALLDVNPSLFDVEAQIKSSGGSALAIKCDVRSSAEVDAAIQTVVEIYGLLDGAANLAGVIGSGRRSETHTGALVQTTDEEWDRVLGINLGGVKNCLRAELQHYNPKCCSIVNASSVSARIGAPFNAAYSTSKAAIVALTKSVAQEMGSYGVRINAIAPGVTDTPMVSSLPEHTRELWRKSNVLGRLADPSEIANVILFLLSEKSSFITSAVVDIDAGRV
ncbi:uncharacterized protein Z518_06462 [Rhinocladiella mackenziei CBS 650.93]|uniref:Ketoreductase domain-containing protein n=1 Tax=Rhinocladiella mackenziei CBS 650.93 TaxID=1442369 RepID=A0A0D2J8Z9_9EURO|nr:uncharacterized protein Z518_06462 [Rhinocladiella mackenziei CBS 650.93]KIX05590.1 hypothetical protein Z518_06462 [Rhinocladiella mackenziei CBS 650.93]